MQLCVALDLDNKRDILKLVEQLKEFDIWLKIGFRTYIRDGKKLIKQIKKINPDFKIFLDLKLYDIPNTMADASEEIAKLGVEMFNIHASSGKVAMQTVMKRLEKFENPPIILAVTALTSFDEVNFKKIYNKSIDEKATDFAKESFESGVDGVVCSAYESKIIKKVSSKKFLTLCPGIRPFKEKSDDQKRVADLKKAKKELVDFIVVGRPIYQSDNPVEIVAKILKKI